MNKNTKKKLLPIFLAIGFALLPSAQVFAQSSSSSANYRVEEAYFGTGGEVDASSESYRAQQQSGALGVTSTSSDSYDANTGALTPSEPFLEMEVTGATVDFGTLDFSTFSYGAAQAGGCNCSFFVRTYLSSQYYVTSISDPPTSENGDQLNAKTTQGAPSIIESDEEFGMNLVANSDPVSFGTDPSNQPDNTFADGKASSGYDTPNQYKYNPGDIIAESQATPGNQAIGLTNYTISYIAKPGINTPAGTYRMNQVLVVVPSF